MSFASLLALALVGLGAVVMAAAVAQTLRLLQMLDPETGIGLWRILAGLMAFFLVGYGLVAFLLVSDHPDLLVGMVGLVFFGGAMFVLLVVGSGSHTIGLLRQREESVRIAGAKHAQVAGQLGAVLTNLAEGLTAVDLDGRIELANPAIKRMLDLRADCVGQPIESVYPVELQRLLRACHETTEVLNTEFRLPGGGTGLAVASSIRDGRGDSPGCVMLVRDITLAKEIDRMKSDFTAVVSHELRTPLTSVLGFAKLIRNKLERSVFPKIPDDDTRTWTAVTQVRQNLDIVVAEGQRLTALINDVLDISKMEAGQIEWNMRPLRVREICERAMAATSSLFPPERPVTAVLEVEDHVGEIVGSEDRLLQVLINLISNASKFTDSGTVTVAARPVAGEVEFSVRDTGMGIRASDHDAVFQRFKQVGDTLTERPKGTGLGLPICKEIVTHHKGRIWVESELGRGSRFAFTIPLADATGELPVDPRDLQNLLNQLRARVAELPPVRGTPEVLVVDDDPALREMLTQQLTEHGYRVRQAADGVAAMQAARNSPPDLIVLDVMMPGISGFDVVTMLRNDPAVEHVPILILSIVEDADRGYRLGVDRYLTKPVDQEMLLKEIDALIRQHAPHRVLVVSERNVPALTEMLVTTGMEVVGSCTRPEALERTRTVHPDVVLVDAQGSEYEALAREIRQDPALSDVHLVWLLDAARAVG